MTSLSRTPLAAGLVLFALAAPGGVRAQSATEAAPNNSPAALRSALDAELSELAAPLGGLDQRFEPAPPMPPLYWPPAPKPAPPPRAYCSGAGWRLACDHRIAPARMQPGYGWLSHTDRPVLTPIEAVFSIPGRGVVIRPRELRR